MAYGKMSTPIDIISTEPVKDAEGFVTKGDNILASVRAYKEVRNTTARWERIIGNAAFASVTAMFRFRKIPGLTVSVVHFITDGEGRYNIVSAEDVRGRGMYVEVLAEKLEGTVM
ncbi:MAG: head-tail adaptor protein [Clostridia bacterium]|nr:head-tail adaptor protein [Clostridia bacterium]